jgi:N-acylneuraminate cytidylyltransferase
MWYARDAIMAPLMKQNRERPEHSSQTQYLPRVYIQNASLEMAWTKTVWDTRTIAGTRVQAFYTEGFEGFDLNEPWDLVKARYLIKHGHATLPEVR